MIYLLIATVIIIAIMSLPTIIVKTALGIAAIAIVLIGCAKFFTNSVADSQTDQQQ